MFTFYVVRPILHTQCSVSKVHVIQGAKQILHFSKNIFDQKPSFGGIWKFSSQRRLLVVSFNCLLCISERTWANSIKNATSAFNFNQFCYKGPTSFHASSKNRKVSKVAYFQNSFDILDLFRRLFKTLL